jgi:hypothetical protein
MAVGQQWASNLLVFSRHLNSAPDGDYSAELRLACGKCSAPTNGQRMQSTLTH